MKSSSWCLASSPTAEKWPSSCIISTVLPNLTTHSSFFWTKAFETKQFNHHTIWYYKESSLGAFAPNS